MKIISRIILRFGYPLRHYIPEYITYTIAYSLFGLINFVMLIPLLDIIFEVGGSVKPIINPSFSFSATYIIDKFKFIIYYISETRGKLESLFFVGAVLLVFNLLANICRYLSTRTMLRFRITITGRVRNELYAKMINQSMLYHLSKPKGEIMNTCIQETNELEQLIGNLKNLITEPILIITFFSYLFYTSVELTLVTVIFLPIAGIGVARLLKNLRQTGQDHLNISQQFFSFMEETIHSTRIIQSHSASSFFQNRHNELNVSLCKRQKHTQARQNLASPLSEFFGIVIVIIILIYGGYLVFQHQGSGLTPSIFITYLIIYSQVIGPLKSFVNSISSIQRGVISAQHILDLLAKPVDIIERKNAISKKSFDKDISFHEVTFGYKETQKALNKFSLNIQKGECVALVGASGSGKTTTSYLLNRFIDPTKGSILIDGIDLRDYSLDGLRSMISYIPQEPVLFRETIAYNVAFGQKNPDNSKIKKALEMAYAKDFVNLLPEKEQTIIGERGMTLSGGERQRITIARAIYKDAPILIMDEATSALDSESEQFVQKAILDLVKKRTSIIIAHRLSTIKHADRIIVMQKGQIVEEGTHRSLMKIKNGHYRTLVTIQQLN